ncbi:MAG TPA: PHP domain-containing protein [Candidatus Saccharimonadales bacterium]|jgi:hypothetical protein
MSYKLDLHTHSFGSADGGLRLLDYRQALVRGYLDYIAITDHDTIAAAVHIKAALHELGDRIIVGEEVMTTEGEIIGLYLHSPIPSGLALSEAVRRVKDQGGIAYVPHPFETVRSGISLAALDTIASEVDIVETCNGRAIFQNRGMQASAWAARHDKPGAASSDSHGRLGWLQTYTLIGQVPTRDSLTELLGQATYSVRTVGMGLLYPKYNRFMKRMSRGSV